MTKLSLFKINAGVRRPPHRGTPHKRKRSHSWVDVDSDDDDLQVKSAKRPSSQSKRNRSPDRHGLAKKPRTSAPPTFSGKDSLQKQRQQLPIYAGTMI